MQYKTRSLEGKFLRMSDFFKIVLVTGARQVGKTTMLRHLSGPDRTYVTMDRQEVRELAKNDPDLFFQAYPPPLLIDEIQKAPELLERIKVVVDASEEKGLFWLTGSQQFQMMKHVQESLAGRVGILHMYGFSDLEKDGAAERGEDIQPACELTALQANRQKRVPKDLRTVFQSIWEGGMPQVQGVDEAMRQEYFSSYVETYLMRDVGELIDIRNREKFIRFLRACASLIGEQVNYATLAQAADISQPTAKTWLAALEGLGIVYLLHPFANNALKRLTRTPKLYFTDTGLCADLSYWLTPETLMAGAVSGHFFENYVIMEMVKRYSASPVKVNLSYYRDSNKKEIDLVVEENGLLHPFEIKKSANPARKETGKFEVLDRSTLKRGAGGIICLAEDVLPIDQLDCYIPCWLF